MRAESVDERARTEAVVIGAGIAGLLAARVLADHFQRVTVIERDNLPSGPHARRGAPQSHHVHGLLLRGHRLLTGWFAGLEEEMAAAGVPQVDWGADFPALLWEGWTQRVPSTVVMPARSRPFLEFLLARRVAALANVRLITGCSATGLRHNSTRAAVTGAHVEPQGVRGTRPAEEMPAGLVVDASGRCHSTPSPCNRCIPGEYFFRSA
jgi:flavin-dependent dehydrogenase